MPTTTIQRTEGTKGERWGGFIFTDPDNPEVYTQTPAASGDIPNEEGIPDSHPGLRVFKNPEEAARAFPGTLDAVRLTFVPPGCELMQVWIIQLEDGRIVDYSLEYKQSGSSAVPFGPDLWVGWTDRAPLPLPASTKENGLPSKQAGEPVEKLLVNGFQGVYQEWVNPPGKPNEAGVRSSINWFDGGRLWFVQAYEPFDVLYQVATGIAPVK